MAKAKQTIHLRDIREQLRTLIFEADTPAGRWFDLGLIAAIIASLIAVMLGSVAEVTTRFGPFLHALEWGFTILFTIEYLARLWTTGQPWRYALSFYGLVDLIAFLPTYLAFFFAGAQSLMVVRSLRLLRVFRVLKLGRYLREGNALWDALVMSWPKIVVFLLMVLAIVAIMGTLMYLIEGEENGFTSIPRSMYWAIVTMTTVGYGDIVPRTVLGQILASALMVLGYGVIAVPTGIVTADISRSARRRVTTNTCPQCSREGHDADATYCKFCGEKL